MSSLMVIVFVVEAVVSFINAAGATTLNNLLWTAFNYLPISTSKMAAKQRKLQAEYLQVRSQMVATSSQDEFAKWARLRRQHDKLLDEIEMTKRSMNTARSKFDGYLTGARMLLLRGPQYVIPFWYAKVPMFWLPHGWFPYAAEWIISFPRAPLGSVSVASWQLACASVIAMLSDLITGILGIVRDYSKHREEPVKATRRAGDARSDPLDEKRR